MVGGGEKGGGGGGEKGVGGTGRRGLGGVNMELRAAADVDPGSTHYLTRPLHPGVTSMSVTT